MAIGKLVIPLALGAAGVALILAQPDEAKAKPGPGLPPGPSPKPQPPSPLPEIPPITSPGQPPVTPGEPGAPSPELLGRIVQALQSGDVQLMRALAAELRKLGFEQQARDLEAAADQRARELAKKKKKKRRSPGLPRIPAPPHVPSPKPIPLPELPPVVIPAPAPPPRPRKPPQPPAVVIPGPSPIVIGPPVQPPKKRVPIITDPRKLLAVQLHKHLLSHPKGTEDRSLVKAFQQQEGLKPSGFYGPGTGKAFIKYAIVPVKPYFWPKSGQAASKANYRQNLLFQAKQDPARADEWIAAAMV